MLQHASPSEHYRCTPGFPDPPTRPQSTAPPFDSRNFGYNISRPSSTSTQSSSQPQLQLQRSFSGGSFGTQHLPALSTLASLAANAPAAPMLAESRSSTPNSSMNQTHYAPAATAGGQQNGPPVCQNCGTSTTPLWRRNESGSVLCNACGLFLKLHGRPRPISLKTDVIKSRNRVKTSSQPKKRDSLDGNQQPLSSFPAAHPDVAHAGLHHQQQAHLHTHGHHLPGPNQLDRAPSPTSISRTNTPNLSQQHNPNIAPQHIFDTVSLPSDAFASPSLPSFALRQPSPSNASLNSSHLEAPQSYDALAQQNSNLRTRVSELEVINDLFRGRVSELEQNEQDARRAERTKDEEAQRLRADLETARAREGDLRRRLEALEAQLSPARKRMKREGNEGETEGLP